MLLTALSVPLTLEPLGPGTSVPGLGVNAPGAGGAGEHAQETRLLLQDKCHLKPQLRPTPGPTWVMLLENQTC